MYRKVESPINQSQNRFLREKLRKEVGFRFNNFGSNLLCPSMYVSVCLSVQLFAFFLQHLINPIYKLKVESPIY